MPLSPAPPRLDSRLDLQPLWRQASAAPQAPPALEDPWGRRHRPDWAARGLIIWPRGGGTLRLQLRLTCPETWRARWSGRATARLCLRWWAEAAELWVDGERVHQGDLFDTACRWPLPPPWWQGAPLALELRLRSPCHDDGALLHSRVELEPCDPADPDGLLAPVVAELQQLRQAADRPLEPGPGAVRLLGHAHLDLAWLWPVADTWRAAERTFASCLALIERHPALCFGHSTPALYAWLEQHRPVLFARIRAAMRAGRWEPLNGPWVETDCLLPATASLLRQFQMGQHYSRRAFPEWRHELAWLPDSFGFSAGLPAVAQATGVRWFCTHKLAWNASHPFPHRLFRWRSRCGAELLVLMTAPIGTDGDPVAIETHRLAWQRATGVQECLWLPGVGDHGGGPTAEMLEQLDLWQQQPAMAPLQHGSLRGHLDGLVPLTSQLPIWRDELYLELHRGCATSRPDQKRHNRTLERLLREAELARALLVPPADGAVGRTAVPTGCSAPALSPRPAQEARSTAVSPALAAAPSLAVATSLAAVKSIATSTLAAASTPASSARTASTRIATVTTATTESTAAESAATTSISPESAATESIPTESTTAESTAATSMTPESIATASIATESTIAESAATTSISPESAAPESIATESIATASIATESTTAESAATTSIAPESAATASIATESTTTASTTAASTPTGPAPTQLAGAAMSASGESPQTTHIPAAQAPLVEAALIEGKSTAAAAQATSASRRARLQAAAETAAIDWRPLLFQQFHDILPGTSIPAVFEQAEPQWRSARRRARLQRDRALLRGLGRSAAAAAGVQGGDARPHPTQEAADAELWWAVQLQPLPAAPRCVRLPAGTWQLADGPLAGAGLPSQPAAAGGVWLQLPLPAGVTALALHRWRPTAKPVLPALGGAAEVQHPSGSAEQISARAAWDQPPLNAPVSIEQPVQLEPDGAGGWWLRNGLVSAHCGPQGVEQLWEASGEALLAAPLRWCRWRDRGEFWDAWDLAADHRDHPLPWSWEAGAAVEASGPLCGALSWRGHCGASPVRLTAQLLAGTPWLELRLSLQWRQRHELLQLEVPLARHQPRWAADCSGGVIERPAEPCTERERARWEVTAISWIAAPELAVLLDGPQGVGAGVDHLRVSLLRAPTWPDPTADNGWQRLRLALLPTRGGWRAAQVPQQARRLREPLWCHPAAAAADVPGAPLAGTWPGFPPLGDDLQLVGLRPLEPGPEHHHEHRGEPGGGDSRHDIQAAADARVPEPSQARTNDEPVNPDQGIAGRVVLDQNNTEQGNQAHGNQGPVNADQGVPDQSNVDLGHQNQGNTNQDNQESVNADQGVLGQANTDQSNMGQSSAHLGDEHHGNTDRGNQAQVPAGRREFGVLLLTVQNEGPCRRRLELSRPWRVLQRLDGLGQPLDPAPADPLRLDPWQLAFWSLRRDPAGSSASAGDSD